MITKGKEINKNINHLMNVVLFYVTAPYAYYDAIITNCTNQPTSTNKMCIICVIFQRYKLHDIGSKLGFHLQ